jgi:hypothetical protein
MTTKNSSTNKTVYILITCAVLLGLIAAVVIVFNSLRPLDLEQEDTPVEEDLTTEVIEGDIQSGNEEDDEPSNGNDVEDPDIPNPPTVVIPN